MQTVGTDVAYGNTGSWRDSLPFTAEPYSSFMQLTTVSSDKGGVGFGVMDVVPILNQPSPTPNSCFLLPS